MNTPVRSSMQHGNRDAPRDLEPDARARSRRRSRRSTREVTTSVSADERQQRGGTCRVDVSASSSGWPTYASATIRVVAAVTNVVASAESTVVTTIAASCTAASVSLSYTGRDVAGEPDGEVVRQRREQHEHAQHRHRDHDDRSDTRISAPKRARYSSTAASSTSPTLRGRSSGTTRRTLTSLVATRRGSPLRTARRTCYSVG